MGSLASNYLAYLQYVRYDEVMRVLSAIEFLDKTEMVVLAENIVGVTALKQKVSLDVETVGGPIDVAFISKRGGFIWIKRKYYFNAELNPFFFRKYLTEPMRRVGNSGIRGRR